jgi:beta-lactamase regulating signal transducer with metallopeptidase domain
MIIYILKSATCLTLLLAFYHLVLEKEKMHVFNRFYLLGSVLFSFLAPLYIIYIDATPVISETIQTTSEINLTDFTPIEIIEEKTINYTQIFIGTYILISFILLMRFGKNIFNLLSKIRGNTKINYQNAKLVLVDDHILPHTFWNYIFINKSDYENQKIEQELFTHELTHVTQKHTLDVIILEVIQIIFWINPFFILLKKAVQLNHEFLADERVINQHKNTFQYQYLLLNKAAWKNDYYLASNLNYSLTKKRLLMMTTQSSHTKILLKKLAVVPLLAGFIFLFAERVEAQEVIYEQEPSKQKSLTDSEIYKEYVNRNGFSIITDKNGKKIKKKFSELTDEEKKKLPPPPPLKSKKKVPTKKLIEDLKNIKKYALWIDGKVIKNKILNNYRATDFSSHFVSFVYKNARSKSFPQNYQAHLSTHKYFEAQNNKRVNDFKKYFEEKYEVEEVVEETDKERGDKVRNELTAEDKLLIPPPPPNPNASEEEILKVKKAYKAWKKRVGNDIPPPPPPIKNKKIDTKLNEFKIQLEKKGNKINLKCLKGCEWKTLNLTLNKNLPQIVNKYGLNASSAQNSDDSFYFVLIQDKGIFDLKSFKNTKWKGLSGSSKENMKLLINEIGVESIIN